MTLRRRGYLGEAKDTNKAKEFVAKIRSLSMPHPFERNSIIFDGTMVVEIQTYPSTFAQHADTVRMASIQSLERGQGFATTAMKKILGLAQKHGVAIEGTVKPLGKKGLNKTKLAAWYKRLGFKVKSGEARWEPK